MIKYDDFAKVELRVGTVKSAERVEGTDKMMRLMVDVGEKTDDGEPRARQILAGLATNHEPESLIGKQIVVIVNLEPRMMFKGKEAINNGEGLESQGMLLAADGDDGPVLLTTNKPVAAGSGIK